MTDLFNTASDANAPLAARLRPQKLEEYFGQAHLLGPDKPLGRAVLSGKLHSMILWGPPGTGKTTLAHLLVAKAHAHLEKISAVFAGVKDIRAIVARAHEQRTMYGKATVLFIDEIHRFNKSQQDGFLPYVEDGTITLIGATTENPSFEINNALLSRARVYVLKALTADDLMQIIARAINTLADPELDFPENLRRELALVCDGDARRCLNYLEILLQLAASQNNQMITEDLLKQTLSPGARRFDKQGDLFYELISALHKSVRGSSPDAALYWFCRMLDGGCDPLYIGRRLLRMASEDIGNADPRALHLCQDALQTYERLGSPEGELALAQAVIYLACAAKSNAVYVAFNKAMQEIKTSGSLEVPRHIVNAPTKLMKELGFGKDYHYAHDADNAYVAGENYLPYELASTRFYEPVARGLEIKIKEKLAYLRKLDAEVSVAAKHKDK